MSQLTSFLLPGCNTLRAGPYGNYTKDTRRDWSGEVHGRELGQVTAVLGAVLVLWRKEKWRKHQGKSSEDSLSELLVLKVLHVWDSSNRTTGCILEMQDPDLLTQNGHLIRSLSKS